MNTDILKQYELDIEKIVKQLTPGHKHLLYRFLHHDGCTMATNKEALRKIRTYEPLIVKKEEPVYGDFYTFGII